mgnify:CR=1 FL=1
MTYEFDPAKDRANRKKHGLGLADGARVLRDAAYLEVPTVRDSDGETRVKLIGRMDGTGKLHTAVFVWRGGRRRFISVRRSNDGEDNLYRS